MERFLPNFQKWKFLETIKEKVGCTYAYYALIYSWLC